MRWVLVAVGMALTLAAATGGSAAAVTPAPTFAHVWQIQLENESASTTFGADSPATYLNDTLVPAGVLLQNYYATGHESLDNYLSEISGQLGNAETFSDCQVYSDVIGPVDAGGQALGAGCVYPVAVQTLPDQLTARGLTWHGYMEDLGNDATRETAPCGQPAATSTVSGPSTLPADPGAVPPVPDDTQSATATDQYAARHNPFVYFHSLIDPPRAGSPSPCQLDVGPLGTAGSAAGLAADLAADRSASYSWITPNLCDDGHDGGTATSTCAGPDASGADPGPGGLVSADRFLNRWIPTIMSSDDYRRGGLIVITFDEAADSDTSSCCGEDAGLAGVQPVGGGGRTGALLISPLLTPHASTCDYNHFGLLRSLEDNFGISAGGSDGAGHLAQAGASGVTAFGPDVFGSTDTCAATAPPALPEAPHAALLALGAGAAVLGLGTAGRRRRGRRVARR